ncbi:neurite extension and migration factor-like [Salmo trutta]|uniref:neurite extension and migration factor-like n=1 Tax=Salmo trutta TaxID=8032 RepID=UPI001131CC10|nr:neurite extension and migration factor-like [Salmo trutta]
MELGGVSYLTEECLLQATPTCLGCFIETRDPAPIHDPTPIHDPGPTTPDLDREVGLVSHQDLEATSCPISDISSINMPCLSQAGEVMKVLEEPLLSDQLLSFSMTKTCHATALATANDKTGDNREKREAEDPMTKNLYEGLLLDKVNVEEMLLLDKVPGEEVLLLDKVNGEKVLLLDKVPGEEVLLLDKVNGEEVLLLDKVPGEEVLLLDKVNREEVLLLDKVKVEEVLLSDKVSGEEVLLANAGQDWGYFESFISESKMELLDLCSKTDLSVNLFSEDDVDNLFDDDDEDSALSSDMCSLKIRYESFQDNMREKTNVLQEDTQFNFFPSVLVNCAKREDGGGGRGRRTGEEGKAEELSLVVGEEGGKVGDEGGGVSPLLGSQGSQGSPLSSPSSVNYLLEFRNPAEEYAEYSDDSSCTFSDTLQKSQQEAQPGQRRGGGGGGSVPQGSRRLLSPSNPLNYGLRSKRKVRYSDDYLYEVDSIGSHEKTERIAMEKREKVPAGQREEDVDWCPKKRRKFSRNEPPVIIKYIIINRFKGQRHMSVNLGRLDPAGDAAVSLDAAAESHYSSLSPLKDFWQERRKEEQLRLVSRDKQHLNRRRHRQRPFSSMHPKRKYKIANRLCVQRIPQTDEGTAAAQDLGSTPSVSDQAVTTEEGGGGRATLEPQNITHTETAKRSRTQEREERDGRRMGGGKTGRIRKFKSQARLSSNKKMKEGGAGGRAEGGSVMNGAADACTAADAGVLTNQEPAGSIRVADISSNTPSPTFSSLDPTNQQTFPFTSSSCVSSSCSSDQAVPSGEREEGVSVIPGGYLQTLLDASDSSRVAGITYYPQQPPSQHYPLGLSLEEKQTPSQHYPLGLSLEEKQFASLQLVQSCVLSPPSEPELQQSHQNCPSFPPSMWNHQPHLCPSYPHSQGGFGPNTTLLSSGFLPLSDGLPGSRSGSGSDYSQQRSETDRLLYEKSYLVEDDGMGLQPGSGVELQELQVCQTVVGLGQVQYQRGSLCSDHGCLISYDSVGSLSVGSSNYSSQSLQSCSCGEQREVGGETEERRDSYLQHCSPTVLFQKSLENMGHPITPLRESSDLLDISNFTPDKFRHSSLSELSPPETPNLSPQVTGWEMRTGGKAPEYQDHVTGCDISREAKWNCDIMQQAEQHGVEGRQFQIHPSFNGEGEEQGGKNTRSKRKAGYKQATAAAGGQQGPKKGRAPRASKTEKAKMPRQSRSSTKIKAMLEGMAAKGQAQAGGNLQPHSHGSTGDWSGSSTGPRGWSEGNTSLGEREEQQEFEEPSNILSNIVSGMAEVQRFMMESMEPLWDPLEGGLTPDANSLNMKTLHILQGRGGKKGAGSVGVGRGRKARCKVGKNQAKFNTSHPIFPQLALGCNMFDKPNSISPGPAHKKLYRHKTSAKFPNMETVKGKRGGAERNPNKDLALMASFEKLSPPSSFYPPLSLHYLLSPPSSSHPPISLHYLLSPPSSSHPPLFLHYLLRPPSSSHPPISLHYLLSPPSSSHPHLFLHYLLSPPSSSHLPISLHYLLSPPSPPTPCLPPLPAQTPLPPTTCSAPPSSPQHH